MAEELNDGGRVAYLEARVGELNQTIGELRAKTRVQSELAEKRLAAREDWKARCQRAEASRQAWAEEAIRLDALTREALDLLDDIIGYVPEFFQQKWGYPAEIASIAARRPQCAVHPDGDVA